MAVGCSVRWIFGAYNGQLQFLGITLHRDVAALPGRLSLLQGSVIELAAPPQDNIELALLLRRRPQFLFECLTHCLHRLPPCKHSPHQPQKRLQPEKDRLTAWVQTLRLTVGSFCQMRSRLK